MTGPGVLAVLLFLAVLILVVWRPRGLSIGWPAAGGAVLAVATGLVSPRDVERVVSLVWDGTLVFVATVLITLVLDAVGFFEWAALHMIRLAKGRGPRLFVLTLALGASVAALFNNDGAILILTPIVYAQTKALGLERRAVLAFVMAGGFVADWTSLPLVVSNLVNIISADAFHIGFLPYALRMVPADAAAFLGSLLALGAVYRRDLPGTVPNEGMRAPRGAIRDPHLFRLAWPLLGLLLAGYLVGDGLGLPVAAVAGLAAIILLAAAWRRGTVPVRALLLKAPWRIVVFAVGMFVVVFALKDAGLTGLLSSGLGWASSRGQAATVFFAGGQAAVLSSLLNNLPAVLMNTLAIKGAHLSPAFRTAAALANVVGADLGPKMTPIGSLATLIWLHLLEERGLKVSWGAYMRVGIPLTLAVLVLTLGALWGVLALIG